MSYEAGYAIFAAGIVTAAVLYLVPPTRRFGVGLLIFGVLWTTSMFLQQR
jgi:hypothetical protein